MVRDPNAGASTIQQLLIVSPLPPITAQDLATAARSTIRNKMSKSHRVNSTVPIEEGTQGRDVGPIVSSAHLAAGAMPALSELEFGLILASHAFERWMVRCIAAAGVPNLSALDVLVLHTVHHRGRNKTLADIGLVLNVEDSHVVNYSIKKLASLGLVTTGRIGKEKSVAITANGASVCQKYRDIREELLVNTVKRLQLDENTLSGIAATLRALSGNFDQAARAAASL
jgi:predicted MarR family transcription regulator